MVGLPCYLQFLLLYRLPRAGELNDWVKETWEWHYSSYYVTFTEVYYVLIIAVALSVLRYLLTKPLEVVVLTS